MTAATQVGLCRAVRVLLRLTAAKRDAIRLIEDGYHASAEQLSRDVVKVRSECDGEGPMSLGDAIELVIGREASDLLDLYDRDPKGYPDGITDDRAYAATQRAIIRRYKRGKCSLCKGPALPCARRHALGRSCA